LSDKPLPKVPEIGIFNKKEQSPEVKVSNSKAELVKPVEKVSQLTSLTSLPKPTDKANDRLKLQPLSSKKISNLKSFDVLLDEEKPIKKEEEEKQKKNVVEEKKKKYEESPRSSIEEDIEEEFEDEHKDFYESQGTSSMGVDASVNSLALEEFDHIEAIRPPKKR
jgi:hypothetical protein